jgi:DNA polymerase III delta prime subunit
MMSVADNLILAERYRPKTIDDCILPQTTKKQLKDAIASGNVPNFLFYGPAGTGKTSAARAIANELGADIMYINASLERNLDIIRNQVTAFSSSVSFGGGIKIVLLDEFDGMLALQQNALKGVIEEFTNARFFFTSNHVNKIVDPIRSRCVNIDFNITASQKADVAGKFFKRVVSILTAEGIEFEKPVVAELVKKHFPDFRRTLNEIQRNSLDGKLDATALSTESAQSFKELFQAIKDREYFQVRKWVASHSDVDAHILFREIFDNAKDLLNERCIPSIVMIISDYQFKAAHAVDQEILITAFCIELMAAADWK